MDEILRHNLQIIEQLEKKVYRVQSKLAYAYKKLWSEMNYFITNNTCEPPEYQGNAYGARVEKFNMVILQLDGLLPFISKTVMNDDDEDAFSHLMQCKAFIHLRLRDVAYKMDKYKFTEPVAMYIKQYTKIKNGPFDLDNRSKSTIINSLKHSLLKEDDYLHLPFYCEEVFEIVIGKERTLVFLVPRALAMQDEVRELIDKTDDISEWPDAIKSTMPRQIFIDPEFLRNPLDDEEVPNKSNKISSPEVEKCRGDVPKVVKMPKDFI